MGVRHAWCLRGVCCGVLQVAECIGFVGLME